MTDYADIYNQYWNDPRRWGATSMRDVEATAESILTSCGGGKALDVGSGMGALVHTLLRLGVDATGLDVAARCVDAGNAAAPGRFVQGSMLALPFPDASFDTVISTDVLEHLEEADVPKALAELARVSRSSIFIRVATTPDRDGSWHLTVRDRAWWERQCLTVGLRRHPMMLAAVPYEALEAEGWQATLVLQKVPAAALARWPLDTLRAQRDLHMDMLREPGRRSDAHIARYWLARDFVRPGDAVLDLACGLGYGSAILEASTQARSILGVDADPHAIAYATAHYSSAATRFTHADAADLSFIPDASIDLVASFETLEHLPDPEAFLDQLKRILRPAGRVVVSVPARWVDDTGTDPNPHHLHVYDWATLHAQLSSRFVIEKRIAQVAGGGMKLKDGTRRLRDVPTQPLAPDAPPDHPAHDNQAEWWLAVAMLDPVDAPVAAFAELGLPDHTATPGFNVAAFGRDYHNPWLIRAMVALGLRCTSKHELGTMAQRVLDHADHTNLNPASPDIGAALCVLGYRLIEEPPDAPRAHAWLTRSRAFEAAVTAEGTPAPHARRWVISNAYLAGHVHLSIGQRPLALAEFRRAAAMDVLPFSPLLASKTIDASWHAGLLAACDGDIPAAAADFRRGLAELVRVLDAGDWNNILGSINEPLPFGLVDLQQGVELASRCAFGLSCLPLFADRPALAWQLVRRKSLADLKRWHEHQQGAMDWLREQKREFEKALTDAREWIAQQQQGREWLEQSAQSLTARLETLSRQATDDRERHRAVAEELKRSAQWHADQRTQIEEKLRERDAIIAELRAYIESQKSTTQERIASADTRIADLQSALARVTAARDWALKQRDIFKAKADRASPTPSKPPAGAGGR